ncbi:hypothetical protein CFP56_025043 [Quercus suber]|uniref:Uncharacterized protein n=1 Tax=Quercus suber TaxID=58331 RepID=A0AAW0M046_QUESU
MADDVIRVGVVLDLNSTVGEVAESYILMADSKDDVVGVACAGDYESLDASNRTEDIHIPEGRAHSEQGTARISEKKWEETRRAAMSAAPLPLFEENI